MRWLSHALVLVAVVLVASAAFAVPRRDTVRPGDSTATSGRRAVRAPAAAGTAERPADGPAERPGDGTADGGEDGSSKSIGRPNRGRLERAALLSESEVLRFKRGTTDFERYGTDELVALLARAAARVSERHPGAYLTVGDLSRRRGGRLLPHRSHRSGRDVDISFYALDDESQQVVQADRFIAFSSSGHGRTGDGGQYVFDVARNWTLVESLMTDEVAQAQMIFVSRGLRARLLAHAEEIGAAAKLIEQAASVLNQPRRGGRHHDHFHLRIYCPVTDRPTCVDGPPFWPWYSPTRGDVASAKPAAPDVLQFASLFPLPAILLPGPHGTGSGSTDAHAARRRGPSSRMGIAR